jgi:hypothetical protein
VALRWAEHVEKKLEMECTLIEGDTEDVLEIPTRPAVDGQMIVRGRPLPPGGEASD